MKDDQVYWIAAPLWALCAIQANNGFTVLVFGVLAAFCFYASYRPDK